MTINLDNYRDSSIKKVQLVEKKEFFKIFFKTKALFHFEFSL